MYYIQKKAERWSVHNNHTHKKRSLTEEEVSLLLTEFPNLKMSLVGNSSLTYFRNRIQSLHDLP
ncbi:MAG: hypothetical protein SF053_16395 [Bacteroidia bacterium]|jgi:hypothetical protein|nr:hypothetical protein [Bacteroidia bacterium]